MIYTEATTITASSIEVHVITRFDDTEIPGILPTTRYIDFRGTNPSDFVEIIAGKIGRSETTGFEIVERVHSKQRKNSEGEPWRNSHEVTFMARMGRRVEIEIARSSTREPKDILEIAFVFSDLLPAYTSAHQKLREFVEHEHLTWITAAKKAWGTEWHIDGRKLLLFLPRLAFLPWLSEIFRVVPCWHSRPRAGSTDPANGGGVSFTIMQP